MEKIWDVKMERIENMSLIEAILSYKGIYEKKDIEEFLSDKPQRTYNPYLMLNMDKAVEKIIYHIERKSKIVVFGDYDVDGVTGTTLLVEFLRNLTNNIDYYIPNRFSEGYGLNKEAIAYIKDTMKADLIITVDNGVSSFDEVEYAIKIGMDIIITDHHNPPDKLPETIVINPKQNNDNYPFKELCGCAVAFKLAQALKIRLNNLPGDILRKSLDLVTLATISDMVPLIDENRTFVKYGLKMINNSKRLGLSTLIEKAGLKDKCINSGRIGYIIGPCFNAAGRIEDAKLGVKLLMETDKDKAKYLADILYNLNIQRQKVQEKGEENCKRLVEDKYLDDDFLVVRSDDISEGVIGIVAGRIKDIFYKPTLVVSKGSEGYLKGSGRSIKGINIYEELKKVSDLFIGFGGHEMACGFSIEEENLNELRERLNKRAKEIKQKDPYIFIPKIDVITTMMSNELNIDLINQLSKLEPYGIGNPKPLFLMKNINVNKNFTKECGSNNTHLKLSAHKDSIFLNGIGFSLAQKYKELGSPDVIDIIFTPEINEFNGKITVQMIIEDIKKAL
ncbi:single-stranded-DNA-specific exonuclease [Alkalithermobacter thermoalcaliphilus JW-YL-7 = DSM 7308]|uniref:Single-stranded-DNA-specific exonuclease RecJ n=1 Tax=Alkalithermobacter thermoalcaliphilus JW-YL-7 = DSM 7308 TaxID=1121328 RepID=A0A150FRB4_CLOPD|nr:single-stranded-DNA-specific exonuclease RecJ [[Clostridium] paradoxum JW-YL-7 = DSM 7308]SHK61931.1 single-stranded-DNA-specific exonuclease [[Clostridium] paradoxum JW-YL-7 = DSM 7308]